MGSEEAELETELLRLQILYLKFAINWSVNFKTISFSLLEKLPDLFSIILLMVFFFFPFCIYYVIGSLAYVNILFLNNIQELFFLSYCFSPQQSRKSQRALGSRYIHKSSPSKPVLFVRMMSISLSKMVWFDFVLSL